MTTIAAESATPSKGAVWTGRILSTLAVLFMIMDGVMKLMKPAVVTESMAKLGYPDSTTSPIGIIVLVCTVLYIIPKTNVLGAVLLTGFLGGAVATNLRVGAPLFGNILFPTYVAAMVWGGLILRDPTLLQLFPFRR